MNLSMFAKDGRFWAGVILAIASIVGYVWIALTAGDHDMMNGVFLFATPFIATLIAAPAVDHLITGLQQNTETTNQINKQTNGTLTSHIDAVAYKAAAKAITDTNSAQPFKKDKEN